MILAHSGRNTQAKRLHCEVPQGGIEHLLFVSMPPRYAQAPQSPSSPTKNHCEASLVPMNNWGSSESYSLGSGKHSNKHPSSHYQGICGIPGRSISSSDPLSGAMLLGARVPIPFWFLFGYSKSNKLAATPCSDGFNTTAASASQRWVRLSCCLRLAFLGRFKGRPRTPLAIL